MCVSVVIFFFLVAFFFNHSLSQFVLPRTNTNRSEFRNGFKKQVFYSRPLAVIGGQEFYFSSFGDHFVKFGHNFGFEVGLHFPNVGEFGKRPTAGRFIIVDARNPLGVHGAFLFFSVFSAVAFDFDN